VVLILWITSADDLKRYLRYIPLHQSIVSVALHNVSGQIRAALSIQPLILWTVLYESAKRDF
jgi:hypothetical protein